MIAIISLLASVVLGRLADAKMKANDAKIASDLRQFRIAADLYYNDNHSYPANDPVASASDVDNKKVFAESSSKWSAKLAFIAKTAEATIGPNGLPIHTSPLCINFDKMAATMVSRKYLSIIPVHPYDNDAQHQGVCYKAVSASSTFAAYAMLTTQVAVNNGGIMVALNKRTGFILGDVSSEGMDSLLNTYYENYSDETPYPVDDTGADTRDINSSIDAIDGITDGADTEGESGIITPPEADPDLNPDPTPTSVPENTVALCSDGIDNDLDGFIDLNDADCPCPSSQMHMNNGNYACDFPPNPICPNNTTLNANKVCVRVPDYADCPPRYSFVINGKERTPVGTCLWTN